jgi:hypothetical protein
MNIARSWKLALALGLVFAAGGVTGSVVTTLAIKHAFESSMRFENWTEHVTAHLEKRLQLSDQQTPKVRAIVDAMGPQLRAVFTKAVQDSGQILVESSRRIDEELTPEQRAQHAAMKREFRAHLKERLGVDLPEE